MSVQAQATNSSERHTSRAVRVSGPSAALPARPYLVPQQFDEENLAMLQDEALWAHVAAVEDAVAREDAGEEVDWDAIIDEHILR